MRHEKRSSKIVTFNGSPVSEAILKIPDTLAVFLIPGILEDPSARTQLIFAIGSLKVSLVQSLEKNHSDTFFAIEYILTDLIEKYAEFAERNPEVFSKRIQYPSKIPALIGPVKSIAKRYKKLLEMFPLKENELLTSGSWDHSNPKTRFVIGLLYGIIRVCLLQKNSVVERSLSPGLCQESLDSEFAVKHYYRFSLISREKLKKACANLPPLKRTKTSLAAWRRALKTLNEVLENEDVTKEGYLKKKKEVFANNSKRKLIRENGEKRYTINKEFWRDVDQILGILAIP